MNARLGRFLKEEDGITALEYGLLAAVVAGVLLLVVNTGLKDVFTAIFDKLKAAVAGGSTTT